MGPVVADGVTAWLEDPENRELLDRLKQRGVDPREEVPDAGPEGQALGGLTFVITGALREPRTAIRERLEALGAKVAGSVSRKTSWSTSGRRWVTVAVSPAGSSESLVPSPRSSNVGR